MINILTLRSYSLTSEVESEAHSRIPIFVNKLLKPEKSVRASDVECKEYAVKTTQKKREDHA